MASYKIIQDIEGEDKILGPLTVKKLFWALLTAALIGLAWYLGTRVNYFLAVPFALIAPVFAFLALPLEKDQPNEVWLAGRLNFMFNPRKRLWHQTGRVGLFSVVRKKSDQPAQTPTEGRSNEQAVSEIAQLSHILDSRGVYIEDIKLRNHKQPKKNEDETLGLDHDVRQAALDRRFQSLLGALEKHQQGSLHRHMRQQLRAQQNHHVDLRSANLSQPKPPHPEVEKAVKEIGAVSGLKISSLEKMIGNLKRKRRLAESKTE